MLYYTNKKKINKPAGGITGEDLTQRRKSAKNAPAYKSIQKMVKLTV
ncbi:MAG: hypothetical protein LBQ82_02650 [Treponema sp.]|nr:hypothetical protein [Treponema sp.]